MMKIYLRTPTPADLPIFFEHQQDAEAAQMAAFQSREKEPFMVHWEKIMADKNILIQTIMAEEQVAGNIVSFVMDGEREVGYWIGREFWGKGIASESLRQFLGLEMRRPLYAHVAQYNQASRRVLEKCGFTIQGYDKFSTNKGEDVEGITFVLK